MRSFSKILLLPVGMVGLLGTALTAQVMPAPSAAAPTPAAPAEEMKECFQCKGQGVTKCPFCDKGQVECPGPCMKLSTGSWTKLNVSGHRPDELWQTFYDSEGHPYSWSQAHKGQVVVMQKGKPVNIGACNICHGSTKMKCTKCQGAATAVCDMCAGTKKVPASWTAFNNPKLKAKPNAIQLADGTSLFGKITIRDGDTLWVRTEGGKTIQIKEADVVNKEILLPPKK